MSNVYKKVLKRMHKKNLVLSVELLSVVKHGDDAERVRTLLDRGADAEARDREGSTALIVASANGCVRTVLLLIERGADINVRNVYGSTALIAASKQGHIDIVQMLVEAGADMMVQNNFGQTALIRAYGNGHNDVVRLLVSYGANVKRPTSYSDGNSWTSATRGATSAALIQAVFQ